MQAACDEAKLEEIRRGGKNLHTEAPRPLSSGLPSHVSWSLVFLAERTSEERKRRASVSASTLADILSPLGLQIQRESRQDTSPRRKRASFHALEEAAPARRAPKLKEATDGHDLAAVSATISALRSRKTIVWEKLPNTSKGNERPLETQVRFPVSSVLLAPGRGQVVEGVNAHAGEVRLPHLGRAKRRTVDVSLLKERLTGHATP